MRPQMDQRVETVCLKMMAKMPAERFASLKAVADELTAILKSPASQPVPKEKPVFFRRVKDREREKNSRTRRRGHARIGVLNQISPDRSTTGAGFPGACWPSAWPSSCD